MFADVLISMRRRAGWKWLGAPLLLACICGCNSPASPTAPTRAASVTPEMQRQAEKVARQYVAALAAKNYAGAEKLMSPAFRAQMPPAKLKAMAQGQYQPLTQAQDLKFDPGQVVGHGRQVLLRATFTGADALPYHTNLIVGEAGSAWQVNSVIPPATRHTPLTSKGGKSAT